MKKRILMCFLVLTLAFMVTGCGGSSSSGGSSKPKDAINSAVGKIKTSYGDYYLKENFADFIKQFDLDTVTFGSTGGIDFKNLDKKVGITSVGVVSTATNPTTRLADRVIDLIIKGESSETLAKDFKVELFKILNGTISINGKNIEIGKTTMDEVVKIFGEDKVVRKSSSYCQFKLDDYTWNTYSIYFSKDVVSQVNVEINK